MAHQFLVHEPGDTVGVASQDIAPETDAEGLVMADNSRVSIHTLERIPLGHKVALRDIARGETVVEYAAPIGEASADIKAGALVHTHNLHSLRWRLSRASEVDSQRIAETG